MTDPAEFRLTLRECLELADAVVERCDIDPGATFSISRPGMPDAVLGSTDLYRCLLEHDPDLASAMAQLSLSAGRFIEARQAFVRRAGGR